MEQNGEGRDRRGKGFSAAACFISEESTSHIIIWNRRSYGTDIQSAGQEIGAAIVGPDASNLISILCVALANGLGGEALIHTIFPHPTLGEVVHEAGLGLSIGAIHYHE